jgi:excinuclease UvrABC helicase subunit UvrB/predicted alpha/beta hydrolase family esterase
MEIKKNNFKLKSNFKPTGDQPDAIKNLIKGIEKGKGMQTLLGVTGSGKTFTMANVIAKVNKPTLIIAHNKTLAAQLYEEMREFFPENRVEYFISYYDYYQPESYLPAKDQYIEKDSAINPRIEQMRHATTASLLSRSDVIVVASVSCIYGLGNPEVYQSMGCDLNVGDVPEAMGDGKLVRGRRAFIQKLVGMTFERNDTELISGRFRVKGDVVDLVPGYGNNIIRVEFSPFVTDKQTGQVGEGIERILEIDKNTGEVLEKMKYFYVWPARNYVVPEEVFDRAIEEIREQLRIDLSQLDSEHQAGQSEIELIKHRLKQRTAYDIEMMKETGTCKGIENYSRHFDGRREGEKAFCLLDYFPKNDFLMIIDESHRTIPQVGGMYNGDRARKKNLIDYGFRLTSAFDNRPLKFDEFEKYMKENNVVFVTATPGDYEGRNSGGVVEQIIRPTGLVDPVVEIRGISPSGGGDDKKNGTRMSTDEHGFDIKGKEFVFLHGYKFSTKDDFWIWLKKEIEVRGGEVVFEEELPNYRSKPDVQDQMKFVLDNVEFNENTVLVSHSLGNALAMKLFPKLKNKISKWILVAPPLNAKKNKDGKKRPYIENYCDWQFDFKKIKNKSKEIVVLSDKNDSIIPVEQSEKIASELDGKFVLVEANGTHFNSGKEPSILKEILSTNYENARESYDGQVRDSLKEIDKAVKNGFRVLLTTLTKRMAEELTDFLGENGVKCRYMHSEIDTFERTEILRELRLGKFDCLVGINLLREGIDIPEIGFVGVLDADKEGFLRDERSLIQIIGRAARNSEAKVVLYADVVTGSIKRAMAETKRRRERQIAYNLKHGITPMTIVKPIRDKKVEITDTKSIPKAEVANVIIELEAEMKEAAEMLDFERAIGLRNKVSELRKRLGK